MSDIEVIRDDSNVYIERTENGDLLLALARNTPDQVFDEALQSARTLGYVVITQQYFDEDWERLVLVAKKETHRV